jgi:Na+-transporting NADH:ubiquinone oxidoreductase subunit C
MREKFKDLLFILILGSICTSILLGIKSYIQPKIEFYQEMKLKSSILEAAGLSYTEDNLEEVFDNNIREIQKNSFVYYLTPDDYYVFEFRGRGLWGMIEGIVTLDSDLETIENIQIISQEETPGLGGRISEESFLAQFRKKKILPRLLLVLRGKARRVNEVDAISGASMTSEALIKMINESVIDFRRVIKNENKS